MCPDFSVKELYVYLKKLKFIYDIDKQRGERKFLTNKETRIKIKANISLGLKGELEGQ